MVVMVNACHNQSTHERGWGKEIPPSLNYVPLFLGKAKESPTKRDERN